MANNKVRQIRIWLWIVTALFMGMFLLVKFAFLGKEEAVAKMVANCTQEVPFAPTWAEELRQSGYSGDTSWVPAAYCQCALGDVFADMSEQDVKQFAKLSPEQRLAKLGGKAVIEARHQSCLRSVKAQHG